MNHVYIVAVLAVLEFLVFGILVGRARAKYGIGAPAISGNEHFERALRVQMNTLKQLVGFLPALFIAVQYWSPDVVAIVGVAYLAGRFLYWKSRRRPARAGRRQNPLRADLLHYEVRGPGETYANSH